MSQQNIKTLMTFAKPFQQYLHCQFQHQEHLWSECLVTVECFVVECLVLECLGVIGYK